MTRTLEHISEFAFGETVQFSILAKNRGETAAERTALSSPATQTVRLRISRTPRGDALLTFTTGGSGIVLGDAATARFDVTLAPDDYTDTLKEGRLYFWEAESESAGGVIINQKRGTLTFLRSSGA